MEAAGEEWTATGSVVDAGSGAVADASASDDVETSSGVMLSSQPVLSTDEGSRSIGTGSSVALRDAPPGGAPQDDTAFSSVSSSLDSARDDIVSSFSPLRIVLNEIHWMGTDLSTADEWIELTAVPLLTGAVITNEVSLDGWTVVSVKEGNESVLARFGIEHHIGSGAFLVVSNYRADASRLSTDHALVTTGMSLPNTKLLLRLYDANGVLQDEVDDGVGVPFAGENAGGKTKASMERIDPRGSGTEKTNWRTAVTSRGIDADVLLFGTPGFPNGTVPTESGASSSTSSESSISEQPLLKPTISEVLPDPAGAGGEEWIEIMNGNDAPLALGGFQLSIGGKSYVIPEHSGSLLSPGSTMLLSYGVTGLRLPNDGGTVELSLLGNVVDQLTYPVLPDGVSYGRMGGSDQPFCTVTGGFSNQVIPPLLAIAGIASHPSHASTINLEAVALSGSIAGARCVWDFEDGFTYEGCNPPPHAMRKNGSSVIRLSVVDYCGNTMEQTVTVTIAAQGGGWLQKSNVTPSIYDQAQCTPAATSGVLITEIMPNPAGDEEEWEWVEIQNTGNRDIRLCGWWLDDRVDGGSKPFSLDAYIIGAGGYLVVPRTASKIALNNDADTVRLIGPSPANASGIVLQTVPFLESPEGEAYATREDGVWLFTPFPTPGSHNRFRTADHYFAPPPVTLTAALPNPPGDDRWGEWVELTNSTGRPQWLNGWFLARENGERMSLSGTVLAKRETLRVPLESTPLELANKKDAILLLDPEGTIRSVLAWENAGESEVIRLVREDAGRGALGTLDNPTIQNNYNNFKMSLELNENIEQIYDPISENCFDNERVILSSSKGDARQACMVRRAHHDTHVGIDPHVLLLQQGLAYVQEGCGSTWELEYAVYEREAQREKRGIWSREDWEQEAEDRKNDDRISCVLAREGLVLTVDPPSGLVESGTVLSITTNVPADLFLQRGTGSLEAWSGSITLTDDMSVAITAQVSSSLVASASLITSVLQREYIVRKEYYPPCLTLSEVFPSPEKGGAEWIEVHNNCDQELPLIGWMIDDQVGAGSRPKTFGIDDGIRAHARRVLSGSLLSILLNNGGDAVALYTPRETVASAFTYPSVPRGVSFALKDEAYCLTAAPTPGDENVCADLPKKKRKTRAKKSILGVGTKYAVVLPASASTGSSVGSGASLQLQGQLLTEGDVIGENGRNMPLLLQLLIASIIAIVILGSGILLDWGMGRRKKEQ